MALIEDYALLGDRQTAALVGRDGSIDWLCLPHFDSPACFAALLDTPDAGRWLLAPVTGGTCTRRRYRGDSLVLETEWDTPHGSVRVVDCLPIRSEATDVVRVVEGLSGQVPMRMQLRLRFDYGRLTPWVRFEDGQLSAVAGPDAAWLRAPVPLEGVGQEGTVVAEFSVTAGERGPSSSPTPPPGIPAPPCSTASRRSPRPRRRGRRGWPAAATTGAGRTPSAVV